MKNPIKWLLRKLIQYALADEKSIWLGWDDTNFGLRQAKCLVLEKRTTDVIDEGRVFYRTDLGYPKYGTGVEAKIFGISKLSELEIDVSKDWGGYNIVNIGNVAPIDATKNLGSVGYRFDTAYVKRLLNPFAEDLVLATYTGYAIRFDNEPLIPADMNILCRAYVPGPTPITSTTKAIVFEVEPTGKKRVLAPTCIWTAIDNPTGSGVTAYGEQTLLLSDGTEFAIVSEYSVAEGEYVVLDLVPRDIYGYVALDGVSIVAYRFYAWVTATPATGYEPTADLVFGATQF